jgi:hypothetical protein
MGDRVTGLGEFLEFGRLFALGSFLKKIQKWTNYIHTTFFPTVKVIYLFCKKWDGLQFGRFWHKLIWSPWCCPSSIRVAFSAEKVMY